MLSLRQRGKGNGGKGARRTVDREKRGFGWEIVGNSEPSGLSGPGQKGRGRRWAALCSGGRSWENVMSENRLREGKAIGRKKRNATPKSFGSILQK